MSPVDRTYLVEVEVMTTTHHFVQAASQQEAESKVRRFAEREGTIPGPAPRTRVSVRARFAALGEAPA